MFPVARVRGPAAAVVVTHVAAVIGAILVIRQGRDARDETERMEYLAAHADAWAMAWMLFVLAAFAMVWLLLALRRRADPEGHDGRLQAAVLFTVLGAAVECVGHCLASALPFVDRDAHLALARAADLMAGTVAALGFGLGLLLAVLSLRRHLGAFTAGVGYTNSGASAFMAIATLFREPELAGLAALIVLATVVGFACLLLASPWVRDES